MAVLTVRQEKQTISYEFSPPMALEAALAAMGIAADHPCGGRGVCGKCAVEARGLLSAPGDAELRAGCRLSCQVTLLGDAEVVLPEARTMAQIQLDGAREPKLGTPRDGRIGAALDIGTTTVALKRYDLRTGQLLGQSAGENPQRSIAADVVGRIDAAMNGQLDRLNRLILEALEALLEKAGGSADTMVAVGNTTMLYLLTEKDPAALARVPFRADCLFDLETEIGGIPAYLPPCMGAFVGADIACAVLSSGMCDHRAALLCDIGTNGEIALWKDGVLHVAATAAGPAFEGAGISCGCGSVPGAIDRVWVESGKIAIHTIGGLPAVGICGSGIIDAVAVLLALGLLDETGAMEENEILVAPGIALTRKDIRAVQLAKAAIAAGIRTLLEASGTDFAEIEALYIAGGFGSHMETKSAGAIGLIPEALASRARPIGNAALAGAARLLLDRDSETRLRQIVSAAKQINLGGNPAFNRYFVEHMLFPEP